MDEIIKQNKNHLDFLERSFNEIHDRADRILLFSQIEQLKHDIKILEDWREQRKRITAQTEMEELERAHEDYPRNPDHPKD